MTTGVKCPNCGKDDVQQHTKTAWCNSCGWAKNRYPDPATGRPIERPGRQHWFKGPTDAER